MSVNYREPQWLLPNEKNLQYPAAGATQGSSLTADRHSLYSMDFDGSNDYIDTGYAFTSLTSFSISAWFKSNDTATAAQAVTSSRINAIGTSQGLDIYLGSNTLVARVYNNGATEVTTSFTDTTSWHHVTMTYNGTTLEMYLDGISKGTATGVYTNSAADWLIGKWNGGANYFNGKIDETAIFSRVLSTSEIDTLYNNGSPSNPMLLPGKPVAYYPLGEQARNPNGSSDWRFPNEVLQGQAIDFDGTDYIDFDTLDFGTGNFSISGWINSATSTNSTIIGNSSSSSYIRISSFGGGTLNVNGNTMVGATISTNQWVHFLITRNGTTQKAFINGVEKSSVTNSANASFNRIGHDSTYFFNGKISNIAIWDTDQSTNKDNIYNYGAPQTSYTVTPTAWYKLDKTSEYAGLNPNWHNALSFDGNNDYIDCGDSDSLSFGNGSTDSPFSISTWVNFDNVSSTAGIISKKGSSGEEWQMYTHSSTSNIRFLIKDDSVNKSCFVTGNTTLVTGKWYHIVSTYNGVGGATAGNGVKIYLNGVEETLTVSNNASYVAMENSTQPAEIGRYDTNYFEGDISNTAVFNQVISAEDVKYLYNGGTPQTNISFEPISWWKLDNLTTGIQDSGSASNNGTNNGATAVSSSVAVDQWNFDNAVQSQTPNWSSALDFSGSSDINCGTDSSLDITGNITLSGWINRDDNLNLSTIITKWNSGPTDTAYILRVGSSGGAASNSQIQMLIRNTSGVSVTATEIVGEVCINKWVHVLGTYDGSTIRLYYNGVELGSGTAQTGNIETSTAPLRIGSRGTEYIDGKLSNVAIYNTALAASAISTLYNNGQPETAISSSPVSWWKLDNTATGIQDSGSASNDGTNNGATEIQTNVWTPRLNGESDTLPSTALVSSDLQFNSAYSSFSLDFDGTDYVDLGTTTDYDTGDLSVSIWVNASSSRTGTGYAISNSGSTAYAGFDIAINTSEQIRLRRNTATQINDPGWVSIGFVEDTWQHLAFTYNDSSNTLKLFLNGVLKNTTTGTSQSTAVSRKLTIGSYKGTLNFFGGKISNAAIFNTELNQAEITSIYNNGYPKDITALAPISWWRLGEDAYYNGTDFTIPNKISGAPNGTSNGMPATALVADAPGSYAAGLGSSLVEGDRVGDAALSTANSLSFNMTPVNRVSYPAGYVPTQADNVYSMAFDGASTKITFPTITLATNYTLSAWAKRSSTANMFLFGNSQTYGYGAYFNGTSNLYFKESSLMTFNNAAIQTALARTDWVHWAFVKDATAGTVSIYVDGVLTQSVSGSGMTTINAIGGSGLSTGIQYIWNGNIDEVAIFDYALSARQIKQDIYNGTTTGKTADLNNISNLTAPIAWYRMGD